MALEGADPIGLVSWFKDLTYAEVHSATWGTGFAGTATTAWLLGLEMLALGLVGVYGVVLLRAGLGVKLEDLLGEDVPLLPDNVVFDPPKYVVRQVRQELQYYIGGGGLGVVVPVVVDVVGSAL